LSRYDYIEWFDVLYDTPDENGLKDFLGNYIEVGDTCAVAQSYGRGSIYMSKLEVKKLTKCTVIFTDGSKKSNLDQVIVVKKRNGRYELPNS
jgi:hypothetical protein